MNQRNALLKYELFRSGHSQRWLSKKTKINESLISQHVRGRYNFSGKERKLIARVMGMPVNDLFQGD